jgi:hypothetical protein
MAGQGKYTNFAPVQKDLSTGGSTPPSLGKADYTLLNTLFGTRPDVIPLTNTKAALDPVMARANKLLTPIQVDADPVWFPKGVYLNFENPDPSMQAPDIANIDVSKMGLGGPSTPYTPNLSSPDTSGAGSTEPVPAVVLTITDIDPKVVLGSDNGTANPSVTALNMFNGSQLPSTLTPGFRPGRTLPER